MKHFSATFQLPLDLITRIYSESKKHDRSMSDELVAILRTDIKSKECADRILSLDSSLDEDARVARILEIFD